MNITISLTFQDLQKIIAESPTMRTLINNTANPIEKYRDEWFNRLGVKSMEEHQLRYPMGSSKVAAIKELRDYFLSGVNKELNDQIVKEGYETHVTPLKQINLGLAAAKQLVEKYFY